MTSAWNLTMTRNVLAFLILVITGTESQWGPPIEFDQNVEPHTQSVPNNYEWGQPHDFHQGGNAGWGEPVTYPTMPEHVGLGAGWGPPIAVDPNQAIPQPNDQVNLGWGAPIAFDPTPELRSPSYHDSEHPVTSPGTRKQTENSPIPSQPEMNPRKLAPASCSAVTSPCGQCKCCFTNDVIRATCKGSNITDIPNDLPRNITHLTVEDTDIVTLGVNKESSFPQSKFSAYPRLKELRLLNNEELSDMLIAAFFFNQPTDIQSLLINGCPNLKIMKGGVLGQFTRLTTLKVLHTGLQTVPGWDLFSPGYQTLIQVDLSYNDIGELSAGAFDERFKTGILTITYNNHLTAIRDFAFSGSTIGQLDLSNNEQLVTLETHAFANIKEFYALDLSRTGIHYLPADGLQTIERLRILNTPSLQTFVSVLHLQVIKEAELTYQHHCCAFAHPEKQDKDQYETFMREMEQECTGTAAESTMTTAMMTGYQQRSHSLARGRSDGFGDRVTSVPRQRGLDSRRIQHSESMSLTADRERRDVWHKSTINPNMNHTIKVRCGTLNNLKNVLCLPIPDAFNPCEDVLGNVGLRFGCWFIVITALVGNLTVIIVSLGNQTKMTVSKLLISNLAFSDLMLGLYLAVLAAFDLYSKSVYFTIAIPWQNDGGCQLAGFLAIFATCLSVYTLTVITVERWYVIRNAIYSKRIRLRVASSVMICGWVYSIVMAMLPLVGVSSYSKTSICLPMETGRPVDKGYVLILMLINAVCFVVISVCCLDLYRRVRSGSTPAGQSDVTVAKIMALLIITDFLCLFPIILFGATAALGYPLISVTNSKILLVICFPLNSCANPFLYAIRMKHFRRDLLGMLSRCGYCEQRALKYRMALTTNPMSYSQSRGSLSGTTQNLIHRPSVASTTLTSCVSQQNNKTPRAGYSHDANYKEAYLNKQMTQESDLGSPPLSPTDNGYCPLAAHDLPVLVSDQRKLSVVIEDGLTPQHRLNEDSNTLRDRGDSSPSGSSRDDLDRRPCPRVRSVSEYSDRLLLKVPRHLSSQHAENDRRKGSEATCLTELSDYSYHTNKSNSSTDSGTNENSPATLRRPVWTNQRRQHKKSFPGDSGIADINGAQIGDISADDEETATNLSVESAEVFVTPASESKTQSAEPVENRRETNTPESTQGEVPRKNLHPDDLYRINNQISQNRFSLRTSPKRSSEGKPIKPHRASDGYFNRSYTFGEVPMCVK